MNMPKLKGIIVERGKTYELCAKALGISVTSFCNKINEKGRWYLDEINALSTILCLSLTEKIDIFLDKNLHTVQEKEGEYETTRHKND